MSKPPWQLRVRIAQLLAPISVRGSNDCESTMNANDDGTNGTNRTLRQRCLPVILTVSLALNLILYYDVMGISKDTNE